MGGALPVRLGACGGVDEAIAGHSFSSPGARCRERRVEHLFPEEMRRSTPRAHQRQHPPLRTSAPRMHATTQLFLHLSPDMQSWWSATVKHRIAINCMYLITIITLIQHVKHNNNSKKQTVPNLPWSFSAGDSLT